MFRIDDNKNVYVPTQFDIFNSYFSSIPLLFNFLSLLLIPLGLFFHPDVVTDVNVYHYVRSFCYPIKFFRILLTAKYSVNPIPNPGNPQPDKMYNDVRIMYTHDRWSCDIGWVHNLGKLNTVNSLLLKDGIWRNGPLSTMVQVMACCLTAPSH